jgi:hypothetical protein
MDHHTHQYLENVITKHSQLKLWMFCLRILLESLRKATNTLSKTVSKASKVQTGYCPSRCRKFMLIVLPELTKLTFLPITAWTEFEHRITKQVSGECVKPVGVASVCKVGCNSMSKFRSSQWWSIHVNSATLADMVDRMLYVTAITTCSVLISQWWMDRSVDELMNYWTNMNG